MMGDKTTKALAVTLLLLVFALPVLAEGNRVVEVGVKLAPRDSANFTQANMTFLYNFVFASLPLPF